MMNPWKLKEIKLNIRVCVCVCVCVYVCVHVCTCVFVPVYVQETYDTEDWLKVLEEKFLQKEQSQGHFVSLSWFSKQNQLSRVKEIEFND